MTRASIAAIWLFLMAGAVAAKGGMQTWILVCPNSLAGSDCNLTTATRWYHLASPQPSAATASIASAKSRAARSLEPGYYLSVEQFPAGVSMGARGNVFRACATDRAAPVDAQAADWAQRGECLK